MAEYVTVHGSTETTGKTASRAGGLEPTTGPDYDTPDYDTPLSAIREHVENAATWLAIRRGPPGGTARAIVVTYGPAPPGLRPCCYGSALRKLV